MQPVSYTHLDVYKRQYLYMSLRGDLEICQACKPCEVDLIVRLGVPKADMKRPLVG